MSKPVKCIVTNDRTPPTPYEVYVDPFGVSVIEFVGDDIMIGAFGAGKPMTEDYLQILLNQAYKRGIDDAVQVIADKLLDNMTGGIC